MRRTAHAQLGCTCSVSRIMPRYIGFRCAADRHPPRSTPLPPLPPPTPSPSTTSLESWPQWPSPPSPPTMLPYVNIPMPQGASRMPFFNHNHDPAIVACPDGSLLASWFSSNCGEGGRCVGLAFARLEVGAVNWSDAAVDLDVQDRTQCCPSYLLQRATGMLVQFSGINAAGDVSGFYRWKPT